MWKNRGISTCHLYDGEETVKHSINCDPTLIAIDAPLSLPAKHITRAADKEMYKCGYPDFPPRFPAMGKLTMAIKITNTMEEMGFNVIEVHPASTHKALKMPTRDWGKIRTIFIRMGSEEDANLRVLTPYEIDAVTAMLTGPPYLRGKIELVGNLEEGRIAVPFKEDWRRLQL
ncbi:MAG: hypothetical protein AOA65_2349 [Candidatus Bathyarchaeota archaeon BA1]|nr:MAG: hypothetical protein AOA65_2349 [Candidatus Bathyarchaeota archaeon BA1]